MRIIKAVVLTIPISIGFQTHAQNEQLSGFGEELTYEQVALAARLAEYMATNDLRTLQVSDAIHLEQSALNAWNGDSVHPMFGLSRALESSPTPNNVQLAHLVATIDCDISAHNPHAGRDLLRVRVSKAKSSGECTITPIGWPVPLPEMVNWNLSMILGRRTSLPWPIGFLSYYAPVGAASHPKVGYSVAWPPDRTRNVPGTQVIEFSHRCLNGDFQNSTTVWLRVPRPWFVHNFGLVLIRVKQASISNC